MRLVSHVFRATLIVLVTAAALLAPAARAGADTASDEASFFQLLNGERNRGGLASLQNDVAAAQVARSWSGQMAGSQTLRHNPDLAAQVSSQVTDDWTRLGENVGRGGDVVALHNAFMASPGHRANVMGDYNRVGIGVVRDGTGQIWVTFVFIKGPPLPDSPPPPPPPPPPAVAPTGIGAGVATWSSGRTDVVIRGGDGAAWARSLSGGSWSPWYTLGGGTTSDPDAVSWGDGRLDVVAAGLDGAIWHRAWSGSAWTPWTSLGGGFTSGPTIASPAGGSLIVLGRGLDGAVWAKDFANGAWGGWYSLGGGFTSDPDAVSPSPGRVVVVGRGLDEAVWSRTFDGSRWGGWSSLGGRVTSAPTIAAMGGGRLDVFARGSDDATWVRTAANGTSWSNWGSLGGALLSAPEAGAANGQLTLVGRGRDDAMWARSLGSSGWSGWFSLR
jgi:hypothetical protein